MSMASNEVDKQAGLILEAIQDVMPELASQVVEYYTVVNSLWLGIFSAVGTFLLIMLCKCISMWRKIGSEGWGLLTFILCCCISFCVVGVAACMQSLIKLSVAPDYFSVEQISELIH